MEKLDIIFWAVLVVLAFIGELLSVSFFLLFFSFGALAGLVIAFFELGLVAQAISFVAASVLGMAVLRPALMHWISFRGSERYESRDSITGRGGIMTTSIEPAGSGTMRIGSGEFWTACAVYHEQRIEAGTRVRVLDTDGITALVEAVEIERGDKS